MPAVPAFHHRLERTRLLALRATAAAGASPERVEVLDHRIAEHRRSGSDLVDADRGLAGRAGLDDDELELLWAVVAATVDPDVVLQLGEPGPRIGRVGLSVAQHALLSRWPAAAGRELARRLATSPLLTRHLVEPASPGPITAATALVAPPRVVGFLAGDDGLDPEVAAAGGVIALPASLVGIPEHEAVRARIAQIVAAARDAPGGALLLQGKRGAGRRTLARAACQREVVAIDLERVSRRPGALEHALAGLGREALLRGACPLIAHLDEITGTDADAVAARRELARFIEASPQPVFLTSSDRVAAIDAIRLLARVPVEQPGPRPRAALWRLALGDAAATCEPAIARAAVRFSLGPGAILAAGSAAGAVAAVGGASPGDDELAEGVRLTTADRLQGLARRHSSALGWDDVVLPDDTRQQIEHLIDRARHAYQVLELWQVGRHLPGTGLAALFSGPPGTGKTLTASLIAQALGLELYRIDLSQAVSKWVGETEKQLDQIFEAAETGHVVLLFDEADALFAKRTEVKGATERYANMEVNFLLQRIESFSGIVILTTNMDGSLDPALRRRLSAHVQFPHPDDDERAALWRRLLPGAAPLDGDLDVARLAIDYPSFAGAHIRNAITTAAFYAAAEGTAITQSTLRRAALEEARAMGRVVRTQGPT